MGQKIKPTNWNKKTAYPEVDRLHNTKADREKGLVFDGDLVVGMVLASDSDHFRLGLADIDRVHLGTAKAHIHFLVQLGVHAHTNFHSTVLFTDGLKMQPLGNCTMRSAEINFLGHMPPTSEFSLP